ncbi:molybdenum cofactor guanylyltransferase MobA [Herbaspirillum sp. YR522]|uniref:molybdenum cofactor guanylyltransferase MobA n=1 Tax=Herbaspirillum sp. YR522 TaxID=1144342 RepID=UPI00026FA32D|nr:molybdenum cofactor guanylyltransferase MobA [Herbaspirillum sp. YR522]EJM95977.1 molybdopterin-guanine dinucleotide biosynthesis protein A, proteobacterial [Herbaspirillum sp. YR522]
MPDCTPVAAISPEHITGLVLAGGRGSRMGGLDKGLQQLHGKPLARHVIARLAPQVGTLAINANRSHARYAAFGYPVWPDLDDGFHGPLAGLQSGLRHCTTPWLATTACDAPLIPTDLVLRLAEAIVASGAQAAYAVTGHGGQRQQHPVCALIDTTLAASLERFLSAGERKMALWFASLRLVEVDFPDPHAFCNINTAQQLQQLEQETSR